MAWLSRNNFIPSDALHSDDLNNLANDDRTWGGNVNGGGYVLSNVILGSGIGSQTQTPWLTDVDAAGHNLKNAAGIAVNKATPLYPLDIWTQNIAGSAEGAYGINIDRTYSEVGDYSGIKFGQSGSIRIGAWAGGEACLMLNAQTAAGDGSANEIVRIRGDGKVGIKVTAPAYALDVAGDINVTGTFRVNGVPFSGGVPTTRQIIAGTGLTGGGDLSADRTLAVVADTTNQRLKILTAGTLTGTRPALNLIQGANAVLTVTDDAANNRVDVTVAATGSGGGMLDPTTTAGDLIVRGAAAPATRLPVGSNGQVLTADSSQSLGVRWAAATGGGSQTPWTSDINAAGYKLYSAGAIGSGTASPTASLHAYRTDATYQLKLESGAGGGGAHIYGFAVYGGTGTLGIDDLTTPGPNRFVLTGTGNVGIGIATPQVPLHIWNPLGGVATGQPTLLIGGAFSATLGSGVSLRFVDSAYNNLGEIRSITEGVGYIGLAFSTYFGATRESMRIAAGGNVGIGTTAPRSQLSIIPPGTPTTVATATQVTICEGTNAAGYQLQLGYLIDAGVYKSVVQSLAAAAGSNLLLNPSGGPVTIGGLASKGQLTITPSTNPSSVATANQLVIGDKDSTSGYQIQLGYFVYASTTWTGCIQAMAGGAGNPLVLNPNGGAVGIGQPSPSASVHINSMTSLSYQIKIDNGARVWGIALYGGSNAYGIDDVTGGASRFVILTSGFVGISNPTPGYMLDVAGDVNCTGSFRVNGTPISAGGGGVTTQSVVTGTRATGTNYRNTTGKPMFVSVDSQVNAISTMGGYSDANASPAQLVARTSNAHASSGFVMNVSFWVLPNNYYRVAAVSGSITGVSEWIEWT